MVRNPGLVSNHLILKKPWLGGWFGYRQEDASVEVSLKFMGMSSVLGPFIYMDTLEWQRTHKCV